MQRSRSPVLPPLVACVALALLLVPLASHAGPAAAPVVRAAPAARTLDDYRHFRAAAIDLLGRMPTRDEIVAFERPDFDFDAWIDKHLEGPSYVERLTRIYMDQLRLEPNPNVNFNSGPFQLSRKRIDGPDGKKVDVYYRTAQRRTAEAIDGTFCFAQDELTEPPKPPKKPAPGAPGAPPTVVLGAFGGPPGAPPPGAPKPPAPPPAAMTSATAAAAGSAIAPPAASGSAMTKPPPPPAPPAPTFPAFVPPTPKKVPQKLLDERTALVRPWWLYRDYRDAHPTMRYLDAWKLVDPEYRPVQSLLTDADGKPTVEIRVCREEAQLEDRGHVYASGRTKPPPFVPRKPGEPFVFKRTAPLDSPFATQHKGEPIACDTKTALQASIDCGCGRGLERCMPSDLDFGGGQAFEFPNHMPLGPGLALDSARQQASRWFPYWWSREVVRFLGYLFEQDRDFREVLTGKETLVNGPLAQFYRTMQRGNCCGFAEAFFGMTEENDPLFDPKRVPAELMPHDVTNWQLVVDRGPHAAGILTMPMFLEKYASARARAATLYNTFLCKSFVAENVQLSPSTENNLMVRPGCSTCHATLEPLAAYFARVEPGSFVFLSPDKIPTFNTTCKADKNGKISGICSQLYDPAFANDKGAPLRSAYGSPANTDATPVGAAEEITKKPEFAECAASRVASSFLGRPTNADDEALLKDLTRAFTGSGFKMRTLVRGILRSNAYRRANNLSSTSWRVGDAAASSGPPGPYENPHGGTP